LKQFGRKRCSRKLFMQERQMKGAVTPLGGEILFTHRNVINGHHGYWLFHVAREAIAHDATILAVSSDRIVRSTYFASYNLDQRPTAIELEWMRNLLGPVRLMTLLHPDAPLRECMGGHTGRGMEAARPLTSKARTAQLRPRAGELKAAGKTCREIAKTLDLEFGHTRSVMQISRWVKGI
jgi:hypothetical protein